MSRWPPSKTNGSVLRPRPYYDARKGQRRALSPKLRAAMDMLFAKPKEPTK